MKAQETLNLIREKLGLSKEEKLELATMQLENGTTLEAEAFEAGNEVFVVTEDERVPLPVGEYEMGDNKILVVSEEGLIAEIKSEESEEELAEESEYASKSELAEVKSMISELKEAIEAMKPKEEMSKQEPKKEELSEEIIHSPELEIERKLGFRMEQRRGKSTAQIVNETLFS